MEVYLNSIEMGDGRLCSSRTLVKDAKDLTPIQAAGIAAILPNPRKFTATSSSSYINNRKRKLCE
jgi:monofunctional biosynthetic peptidoglycan transglycosylase